MLQVFFPPPRICSATARAGNAAVAEEIEFENLIRLLEALASPIRLKILCRVADRPVHRSFLLDQFGCTRQTVSRHIRMLEAAGIITTQPEPAWRVYRLQRKWIGQLDDWLAAYRCKFAADSDNFGSL
jgi:DNA-binding transcriptional ArsR family regulator